MPRLIGRANPNWAGGRVGYLCEECGKAFSVTPCRAGKARFCSMACTNIWQKRMRPNRGHVRIERVPKVCRECGSMTLRRPKDRLIFCTVQCHREWRVKRMTSGGNVYSSARRGKRLDLGTMMFRSSWEANYARYLNFLIKQRCIKQWEYEPETFWFEKIRRGCRSYTPDFRITGAAGETYYVEVKGWMDAKSKTKLKRMAKYYPATDIRLVQKTEYREIERKLAGVIPNWERVA